MAILGICCGWSYNLARCGQAVDVLQPSILISIAFFATSTMGRFLTSTALALLAAAGVQAADESGMWGQCGGNNWSGPKKCVAGAVCTYQNDWYCR